MERRQGVAVWRRIRDALRQDIAAAFKPGDRLPTEVELAGRFGVNRHTLRRAMAALEEEGLVHVRQGCGTFVAEDVIDYALGRRTRFSENIARLHRTPGGRLLRAEVLPAEAEVARGLEIERGAPVILLERVCEADGRPTNVSAHHFPQARVPGLIDAFARTGSITRALADQGVADYLRRVSRVTAILPDEADARLLQQVRTQPVLLVESVNVEPDGRPVEYSRTRFAATRVQLVLEPLAPVD